MGRVAGGIRSSSTPRARQAARQPAAGSQAAATTLRDKVNRSLTGLSVAKRAQDNGKNVSLDIRINSQGRNHIINDLYKYGKDFQNVDASKLNGMLKNASFIKDDPVNPNHKSSSRGVHFYYFKARRHNLYFNVAKVPVKDSYGNILRYEYRLYALTNKLKK